MNGRDDDANGEGGLNLNDPDPSAGASDVGGRAGGDDDDAGGDARGADGHEPGGGHTGLGKGPTGS